MAFPASYGIGIVGCGNVANVHAQAITKQSNARLISVFSRNADNAKKLAEKYRVDYFTDWQPFAGDKNIQVVAICTPSGTHFEYARLAAEAGKHVIVEKPIEVTLARARRLIECCRRNQVHLAVIFQNRFLPDVIRLKRVLDNGELGKIFQADAYVKWYRSQEYYDSAPWRGTFELDGGGVLINQAIHTVDLLQWLVGVPESVYGQIGTFAHERIEGEDTAVATFQFKGGALGLLAAATSIIPGIARRLEIHGEKGSAILKGDHLEIQTENLAKIAERKNTGGGTSAPFQGFSYEPHWSQYQAIIHALDANKPAPITGEESLKSLAIVLAIYESHERKSPVSPTLIPG